ncbi:Glycosyltransferase, GT2 family [Andreprevotia lacus DSM 23236]|jgi:GT2 family glycosyltransferase|uniref:Glycosyltransferase, GT2 family n=1 Tax=Andreprevotia lacus DSM 23236 TaxID=1121001 RepID=A0A1W1XTX0_9NEIS|nr:glycosyltransferase [Andreprevotia lacus]SMC27336.1 Glycosyltransferase, GT2 family [Andreprevotia lacus DSM 23236]
MISIITAVYNQRAVNELFWESLQRYTRNPFQLVIVDNGSTDGSAEFFESVGATVIRNGVNYSYPKSQNIGIAVAKHDWLAFLNNDIIVSPDWDARLIASMQQNGLLAATVCGIEQIENAAATKRLKRRWQKIKNVLGAFSTGKRSLKLMHTLMYGNWEAFCRDRQQRFAGQTKQGFVGNTVMLHRDALDKVGLWDERVQAADFDLYLRTRQRAAEVGDIKPLAICLDVFIHHYIRLTFKAGYPPFADRANLIALEDKWPADARAALDAMNQ